MSVSVIFKTLVLAYFYITVYGQAGDQLTTTTFYQTISNHRTVTSYLSNCNCEGRPPLCNQVTWSPLAISNSSTSTSSTFSSSGSSSSSTRITLSPSRTLTRTRTRTSGAAITTEEPTSTGAPNPFVLSGGGTLGDSFFSFEDASGRVFLSSLGTFRLAELNLEFPGNGLLTNARDPSELVWLRYNETLLQQIFASEITSRDEHGNGNLPKRQDISAYTNVREVRFGTEGNILTDDLPATWSWNDTTTEPELLSVNTGIRFVFYRIASIADSINPIRVLMAPEEDESLIGSFFVRLGLRVRSPDEFPTSWFEMPTATETSSDTTVTNVNTNTGPPTPTADAYDVIVSLSLQNYCTSLLKYFPTTVSDIITTHATSYSDVYGGTAVVSVYTATVTDYATTDYRAQGVPQARAKARDHLWFLRSRRDGIIPRQDTPSALTLYQSSQIESACSRVATPPPISTIDQYVDGGAITLPKTLEEIAVVTSYFEDRVAGGALTVPVYAEGLWQLPSGTDWVTGQDATAVGDPVKVTSTKSSATYFLLGPDELFTRKFQAYFMKRASGTTFDLQYRLAALTSRSRTTLNDWRVTTFSPGGAPDTTIRALAFFSDENTDRLLLRAEDNGSDLTHLYSCDTELYVGPQDFKTAITGANDCILLGTYVTPVYGVRAQG